MSPQRKKEFSDELFVELDAALRSVPGVVQLYPHRRLLLPVRSSSTSTSRRAATHYFLVHGDERLSIALGVGGGRAAAETLRQAYDTARAWATRVGRSDLVIDITAATIES